METTTDQLWKNMQRRLADTRKRLRLIPRIRAVRKEAIILSLQLARSRGKAFDKAYKTKQKAMAHCAEQLETLQSDYGRLAESELDHLRHHLVEIDSRIAGLDRCDLDLQDHRNSLQQAIDSLDEEVKSTLKPLMDRKAGGDHLN